MKKKIASLVLVFAMLTMFVPSRSVVNALTPNSSIKMSSSYKSGPYYTKLLNVTLSGNGANDIVAVAKSQIGYKSGSSNSDMSGVTSSTSNVKYSEYGYAIGSNPNDWCAYFVSWCARQANISANVLPNFAGCSAGYNTTLPNANCVMHTKASGYKPKKGDIIFFLQNDWSHVGIVSQDTVDNTVHYIDGNNNHTTPHCVHDSTMILGLDSDKSYKALTGYATPNYNFTPVTHTRNTNYGTNFKATAKAKQNAQDENHNTLSNHWVSAGDPCVINEVYTDGCCKVTYPAGDGTATYFFKISNFEWNTSSHTRNTNYGTNFSATAKIHIDVFNEDHTDPGNYYIDPGDPCIIHEVYTDGCCKVTYPSESAPNKERTYYCKFNSTNFDWSSPVPDNSTPVNLGTDFYANIVSVNANKYVTNDSNNVCIRSNSGGNNQIWKFERQSDNSYKIISALDNKVMDVDNASNASSANVQVWDDNGTAAQRWLVYGTEGSYQLKAQCTDCRLDVQGGNTVDGTNVFMWEKNNSQAQNFNIVKTNLVTPSTNIHGNYEYAVVDGMKITVVGWAYDTADTSKGTGIQIYADDANGNQQYIGGGGASESRQDVDDQLHVGVNHGFCVSVDALRTGTYNVYVYAISVDGKSSKLLGSKQVTVEEDTDPPVISDIQVTVEEGVGYTVICKVTDNVSVSRVRFPTWTENNGQDDLVQDWGESALTTGEKNGDIYTYHVKISDHNNELGVYRTHIYAWDGAGNYAVQGVGKVTVTDISTYTITYNANGGKNAPSAQTKTHGKNLTLSSTEPTRDNYTFLGWSENKNATTATYTSGAVFSEDKDATLYAIWQKNASTHTPGDINGDGSVNNKDLTRLMKYIAGENVEVVEAALDVNGDGTVNNKDLTRLMKYLAGAEVAIN